MSTIRNYNLKLSSSLLFPILYLLIDSILYNSLFFFSKTLSTISIENIKFIYEIISFLAILYFTIKLMKIYKVTFKVKKIKLQNLVFILLILLIYIPFIIWVSNKILLFVDLDLGPSKETVYFNNMYYLIIFTLITPIKEELFFRGFLFKGLSKRYNIPICILATSIFFGISHLNPVQMVSGIIFGIISSILYLKTDNFLMPLLLHTMNNLIVYVILNGINYILFIVSAIIILLSYLLVKRKVKE